MGKPNGYAYLFQKQTPDGEKHLADKIDLRNGVVTATCGIICKQPCLKLEDIEDNCTCYECREDCGMEPVT